MSQPSVRSVSRRRFLIGLTGFGALGVLAAGCSSPSSGPPAATPAATANANGPSAQAPAQSSGPVTVSFSSQTDKTEAHMFDLIIDGFEKSQNRIKVDKKYDPSLSWPKIINMIRTGVAADVQRTDDDSVWVITAAGVVTVLDDYFRQDLRKDDYYPLMFQRRVGPGGELGAAYIASYPIVAYFNTELMDKHNVKIPTDWIKDNWDIDKFTEILATVTEQSGGRTNVFGWTAPDWWIPVALYQNGVEFFNQDQTKTDFASPAGIEVFTKWQSWFKKGYAVPPGEKGTQLFNSNLLAIDYSDPQFGFAVKPGVKFEIGPTWKGKVRTAATHAGRCFAIPQSSKYKDEAWELMKWLWTQTPDGKSGGQAEIARWGWGVPMLKAAAQGPVFKENKPYKNLNILTQSMELDVPPWPRNPLSESFMIPWRQLDALDTGKLTPEEYAKKEVDDYFAQQLTTVGWNASMDTRGYRLPGVTEKLGVEK